MGAQYRDIDKTTVPGSRFRLFRVGRLPLVYLKGVDAALHTALRSIYGAEVAQLVEQRTENPCVGSSSLPLGTTISN